MLNHNFSKLQVSKSEEKFTEDKLAGTFSRWLESDQQRLRVVLYPTDYEADHICYNGHALFIVEGSIKIG
ncbi:hypothetical protein ACDX78_12090 [Virgibacillus oceani]